MKPTATWLSFALVSLSVVPVQAQTDDDFSITGETVQRVALDRATRVVVRCFCVNRNVRTEAGTTDTVLRIAVDYGSVGYHGDQQKPRQIDDRRMQFASSRDGDTLVLESREWTMIHHAFVVRSVDVIVPEGVDVRFEPIDRNALEGRRPR